MRNASHRSICRLRRAARRVGGRQEGVAGRDPSQGSPVPSSTPTPTPQENPQPGTPTRPQSPPVLGPATPHIPCAPSQGVHLCLGALTSLHSSVHLPRSICLSLCVCLSFSGCVACFSRVLSFHECLPISLCPPVSPASPCPPVFSLPAPWVFSSLHLPLFPSLDLSAIPLSHCPSVHVVPVSVSPTFCTRVFSPTPALSVQQSPCHSFSLPTVCGDAPSVIIFPSLSLLWSLSPCPLTLSHCFDQGLNPVSLLLYPCLCPLVSLPMSVHISLCVSVSAPIWVCTSAFPSQGSLLDLSAPRSLGWPNLHVH